VKHVGCPVLCYWVTCVIASWFSWVDRIGAYVPVCLGVLFINEIVKLVGFPVLYYWVACVIASWFTCVDSMGSVSVENVGTL